MSAEPPFVTAESGPRPAGRADQCFYCGQMIGERHKPDCVIWTRKVMVRMIVEYPVEYPVSWTKEQIEFHRNEGSWCASNGMAEVHELIEKGSGCGCGGEIRYEYVGEVQ